MKVINEQTKQEKADKPYTMIVKPTHDCNLNCAYCFDRPLRKKYGKLIMNMDTVKRMVENMNRDQRKCYCFTWHGGEPLMCGVEWYEKSMEYMYKNLDYIPPFTIQTNGTLLTEEYIAMLTSYKIYIGVSYDFESEELGIKSLRKNITEEHMGQINEWIKKYQGTPIGSITVVNAENYKYLKEIQYYCLVMTKKYIENHFDDIKGFANIIENRLDDSWCTKDAIFKDNAHNFEMCKKYGCNYILIDNSYQVDIKL